MTQSMLAGERPAVAGGRPVRSQYLVFGEPCLDEEEIEEIIDTLKSGWIGTGPKTELFEKNFADYIGCKHALAVSSCTAGLHLGLLLAGVGPGDEVITTPLTFAATANVIVHTGATPVFADVEPLSFNIDPERIAEKITARTKAIVPVHFAGLPCDLKRIGAAADANGLVVIEDAAHAVGALHRGLRVGNHGSPACFSFYANKNMTTAEGGMITTDDDELAEKIRLYRLHGLSCDAWQRYSTKEIMTSEVLAAGFKYNMTDLQASLGLHQLNKLERFLRIRENLAEKYDEALADVEEIRLQPRPRPGSSERHAMHLYLLKLDTRRLSTGRDGIVAALRAENIGVGVHYRALHLEPYYRRLLGSQRGDYPHAERLSDSLLSLPLSPAMNEDDVSDVIRAVKKVLRHFRQRAGTAFPEREAMKFPISAVGSEAG